MNTEIDTTWHQWKNTLGRFVKGGEAVGLSENSIDRAAFLVGDFLANHVDPANREQRLLKELWEQGDEGEKKSLARLVARMTEKSVH